MRSVHSYPVPRGLQQVCWLVLIQSHGCTQTSSLLKVRSTPPNFLTQKNKCVDFGSYLTRRGSDIEKESPQQTQTFYFRGTRVHLLNSLLGIN